MPDPEQQQNNSAEVRNFTLQLPDAFGGQQVQQVQVETDDPTLYEEFRRSAQHLFTLEGDWIREGCKSLAWLHGSTLAIALLQVSPWFALFLGIPLLLLAAFIGKALRIGYLVPDISFRLFLVVLGICAGWSHVIASTSS